MIVGIRIGEIERLLPIRRDIDAVRHHVKGALAHAGESAVKIAFLELRLDAQAGCDLLRHLYVKADQLVRIRIVIRERRPLALCRHRDLAGGKNFGEMIVAVRLNRDLRRAALRRPGRRAVSRCIHSRCIHLHGAARRRLRAALRRRLLGRRRLVGGGAASGSAGRAAAAGKHARCKNCCHQNGYGTFFHFLLPAALCGTLVCQNFSSTVL